MGSRSSLLACRRAEKDIDHGDRVLRERHYIAVGNYLWLCGDGVDHEEKSVNKLEIVVARQNVIGGFNRLKHVADEINDSAWKSFFAGAMNMCTRQIDDQLAEFGVKIEDGKT